MQNFKTKSEMKAKVNLVEDKPKRKFMNPKGYKFKKPNRFHSFLHVNSSSFKPSQSSSFKPKILGQKTDERFVMSAREPNTWRPSASTGRRNQSRLNQEETEGTMGTRST